VTKKVVGVFVHVLPLQPRLQVRIDYVVVSTYNQYTFKPVNVILAKALVNKQFAGKYTEVQESDC
jgi:ABC-type glucose/galactose transport system permease subunit